MSDTPHRIYLFRLRNGRRRLAYGTTPNDALETLGLRLDQSEMAQIVRDDWITIHQRDLLRWVGELG